MSKKISIEDVKSLPPEALLILINKLKGIVKKDPVMQKIFSEYNIDLNEIDFIPMYFKDLDVSAKCDHGIIYINYKLLEDGLDLKDASYLIHEITHYLQQTSGDKPTQSSDYGKYLDNPFEQEGFQNQISYISEHFGEDEAEKYVDHLLNHHDIDDDNEKDKLENILLEKI